MNEIKLKPIGVVKNSVTEKVDENWGEVVSHIIMDESFIRGLKGLEQFSHAIVIYHLHQAKFDLEKHITRRPRGLASMPEVGIFSQRAKDRPNALGMTAVKIVKVGDGFVDVQGLDAIDGTPVLDIKPYYPHYDLVSDATVPEWVDRLMKGYF
jgi:tRNA-Thr(GGU) m(6)t(6)A37 methyltransferase TsaA